MVIDRHGKQHQEGGVPSGGRYASQQRADGTDLSGATVPVTPSPINGYWSVFGKDLTVDATMIDGELPEDFFTRYGEGLRAIRDSGYRGRLVMSWEAWSSGERQLLAEAGSGVGGSADRFLLYFDENTGEVYAPYGPPMANADWHTQLPVSMEEAYRSQAFKNSMHAKFGTALGISGHSGRYVLTVAGEDGFELTRLIVRGDGHFELPKENPGKANAVWSWVAGAMGHHMPQSDAAHSAAQKEILASLKDSERDPGLLDMRQNRSAR